MPKKVFIKVFEEKYDKKRADFCMKGSCWNAVAISGDPKSPSLKGGDAVFALTDIRKAIGDKADRVAKIARKNMTERRKFNL